MKNLYQVVVFVMGAILSAVVCAADMDVEAVSVRATLPSQTTGMVLLTITSKQAATLIGASSLAAKSVELHSMTHENGMMKMREVKAIDLPMGKTVNFENSGYHLMLIGLKTPLKASDNVHLTLKVKVAQHVKKIKISAVVKATEVAQTEHDAHSQH